MNTGLYQPSLGHSKGFARRLLANLAIGVYRSWISICARLFAVCCGGAFYRFGRGSIIQLPVRLRGERRIAIGNRVFIGAGSWLQVLNEGNAQSGAVISIGNGCSITGFCTISAAASVVIEEKVLIARYVYIADHAHAHADHRRPIVDQDIERIAPVRIGEGAWLGQSVVVCPGVTIGKGAVIGANAVVRHDVPDHCVAAGVPARIIRKVDERRNSEGK